MKWMGGFFSAVHTSDLKCQVETCHFDLVTWHVHIIRCNINLLG